VDEKPKRTVSLEKGLSILQRKDLERFWRLSFVLKKIFYFFFS
jgi:hypothetical protein